MPLLMCPNCQSGMQSLTRSGVEFDMCPTCRGVWLDRGELEKIVEGARGDARAPVSGPAAANDDPLSQRRQERRGDYGERGEYGEYGEHGHFRRRRRGLDIFDIFD